MWDGPIRNEMATLAVHYINRVKYRIGCVVFVINTVFTLRAGGATIARFTVY